LSIDVILNPRSRANRRDPGLQSRVNAMLGPAGRVVTAADLDGLDDLAAAIAEKPPEALAIHGGDGTLHKTISALIKAFGAKPLPPVAILPGGTMNVVASSLGILGRPESILGHLVLAVRAARSRGQVPTVRRHCLKVNSDYGFVFGNGLMANFLEEYYRKQEYGSRRALWILARTFTSGLVGGSFARKIVRPFEGRVLVDGQPLTWQRLTGVGAATVREVGLGFKLNHRADEDPERFCVLAIHGNAVALGFDLPAVHAGRGISPKRAQCGLGRALRIEAPGAFSYTVDGDLYRSTGTLAVDLGPTVPFFHWR
jgi:diacylglycerol kinase (ATP)